MKPSTTASLLPSPPQVRLTYSDRDLDALGVLSRKTRWRLRRAGAFPEARRAGGRIFYLPEEIDAWRRDPAGWTSSNSTAAKKARKS